MYLLVMIYRVKFILFCLERLRKVDVNTDLKEEVEWNI